MNAVPPILTVGGLPVINPWKFVDDVRQFWETITDTLWGNATLIHRRTSESDGLSASEIAHEQFNQVQWLLYRRHIKRRGWRIDVSPARECWRFTQWTRRHSKNFRQLLALYQIDWFRRYADIMKDIPSPEEQLEYQSAELELLFREIECHLYQ